MERRLAALEAHRQQPIDPEIAWHQGRIVKLMGDGIRAARAALQGRGRAPRPSPRGRAGRACRSNRPGAMP
ncbi:MAG: hypothetical protein IH786_03900 [Proteobacteria bacterium]|nr:hypothetical protein [Pseudomonadota bacterium]